MLSSGMRRFSLLAAILPAFLANAAPADGRSAKEPKSARLVYYPKDSMIFAFSKEHYWFGYNCNHKTCDWLKTLGCEVHGTAMFGRFKLAE